MKYLIFGLFAGLFLAAGCTENEVEPLVQDNPYVAYENEVPLELVSASVGGGGQNCRVIIEVDIKPDFRIFEENACTVAVGRGTQLTANWRYQRPVVWGTPTRTVDMGLPCRNGYQYILQLYDCEGYAAGGPLLVNVAR